MGQVTPLQLAQGAQNLDPKLPFCLGLPFKSNNGKTSMNIGTNINKMNIMNNM